MSIAACPETAIDSWRSSALAIEEHVSSVFLGQRDVVRLVNIAIMARGHVLLQGDVGVGKTTLLRAFARLIGGVFARIEGTVDLMPNDLIYYTHVAENGRPAIDPGPLLRGGADLAILFFNEINRARPQVHALLLRVMAERSVGAFNREYRFPHLLVFADRNRLEREETFDIAAAALDRFMFEIVVEMPADPQVRWRLIDETRFHDTDHLLEGLPAATIDHRDLNAASSLIQANTKTSSALSEYALALWEATRRPAAYGVTLEGVDVSELVLAGASPRGMSLLLRAAKVSAWLEHRDFVTPEDLQRVFAPVIAHRLSLHPLYELRRAEIAPNLCRAILQRVAAP